jgi:AraC family transcriptional regulator
LLLQRTLDNRGWSVTTWVPIGSGDAKLHDSRGEPRLRIPAGWRGLPVELLRIRGQGENRCRFAAEPALLVSRSGGGRRWYRSGTVVRDLDSQPRMFDVYGADYEYDHARWEGLEGECIAIWFPRSAVRGLLRPEARQLEWATRQAVHDDDVARLAFALADDAAQGSPRGSLAAQEISLALIRRLLAWGVSRTVPSATSTRTLAPGERQLLRDLIEVELGGDLTLERMAAHVGMSVFHFVRLFRSTFGTTPHQYVLGRRLAAAQRMLFHEPSRPIVDIALACGFASQAHLSDAFRLHLGKTPAAARAGL